MCIVPNEPRLKTMLFLGYLARRQTLRPKWLDAAAVIDVANASIDSCEAVGFPGANEFALHDSIETALDQIESPGDLEVFGYRVLAVAYDESGERPLRWHVLTRR